MNKKERSMVMLIVLIILFSVINFVIVFEVHMKNIDDSVMADAERVVYLKVAIEKYAYYSMFWFLMLTITFISLIRTRTRGKRS